MRLSLLLALAASCIAVPASAASLPVRTASGFGSSGGATFTHYRAGTIDYVFDAGGNLGAFGGVTAGWEIISLSPPPDWEQEGYGWETFTYDEPSGVYRLSINVDAPFEPKVLGQWYGVYSKPVDVRFNADQPVAWTLTATGTAFVPEPSTWAMMIAGIGLVRGGLRQRRGRLGERTAAARA